MIVTARAEHRRKNHYKCDRGILNTVVLLLFENVLRFVPSLIRRLMYYNNRRVILFVVFVSKSYYSRDLTCFRINNNEDDRLGLSSITFVLDQTTRRLKYDFDDENKTTTYAISSALYILHSVFSSSKSLSRADNEKC